MINTYRNGLLLPSTVVSLFFQFTAIGVWGEKVIHDSTSNCSNGNGTCRIGVRICDTGLCKQDQLRRGPISFQYTIFYTHGHGGGGLIWTSDKNQSEENGTNVSLNHPIRCNLTFRSAIDARVIHGHYELALIACQCPARGQCPKGQK